MSRSAKALDLKGQIFGNLIVTERSYYKDVHGAIYWLCKCLCGRETRVRADNLVQNRTKNCPACYNKKIIVKEKD